MRNVINLNLSTKEVFKLPDFHPEDDPINIIPQSKWYMSSIYLGGASLIIGFIFEMHDFTIPFIVPIGAVYKVISFGAYTLIIGFAL